MTDSGQGLGTVNGPSRVPGDIGVDVVEELNSIGGIVFVDGGLTGFLSVQVKTRGPVVDCRIESLIIKSLSQSDHVCRQRFCRHSPVP